MYQGERKAVSHRFGLRRVFGREWVHHSQTHHASAQPTDTFGSVWVECLEWAHHSRLAIHTTPRPGNRHCSTSIFIIAIIIIYHHYHTHSKYIHAPFVFLRPAPRPRPAPTTFRPPFFCAFAAVAKMNTLSAPTTCPHACTHAVPGAAVLVPYLWAAIPVYYVVRNTQYV